MCGILAWFGKTPPAKPLSLELIHHRGPDSQGTWESADGRAWFGHARLSIRDLSPAGAQPMVDPETGNVIVFNGEIYNDPELRRELAPHRIAWRGTSDTETLLMGYRHWGPDLLRRAKGMFAFLIYDVAKRSLFGARDRLGIKPLYLARQGEALLFASEVRVLLEEIGAKASPTGVANYLRWGAVPEQCSLFEGLEPIPAGHWFRVSPEGALETHSFWTPGASPVQAGVPAAEAVRALLEKSVREHLLSDVPVASFLSGGIDSSVITALAAQFHGSPIQTFSIGFSQGKHDETRIAAEVARRYATNHTRIELSEADILRSVTEAVTKLDLPSVDAINTYIVSKAVQERGVKVALSGLGGDELFGGYPSFKDVPKLQQFGRLPRFLRFVASFASRNGARLRELPPGNVSTLAAWRRAFWTEAQITASGLPVPGPLAMPPAELRDDFARISWAELTGYMRHMLLKDSDQMSMAVSLELRVPFLDHELVDYALSLAGEEKQFGTFTKPLLVKATADLIPSSVYDRPKQGFVLPMAEWIKGPLASFTEQGISALKARSLLDPAGIDASENAFRSGALHWTRFWALVVLGHYLGKTARTPA